MSEVVLEHHWSDCLESRHPALVPQHQGDAGRAKLQKAAFGAIHGERLKMEKAGASGPRLSSFELRE